MRDAAIRLEGLGKRYRLGAPVRYKTLRDGVAGFPQRVRDGVAARWAGARRPPEGQPAEQFLWALRDVSCEVGRGEVVGVIGRNGAGKSTLLKILSRITEPTTGSGEIAGRVGSLLEVGTGFHPELTGRENIYLNGAILGMTRRDIRHRFDAIVSFAETERFLDTPVKHYSSGMYVRLAFAVAAHLEPDVLLVDEVLAVGDAAFQRKCLGRMGEVAKGGRTVVFVSHNLGAVQALCSRALWLEQGRLEHAGPVEEVIRRYLAAVDQDSVAVSLRDRTERSGHGRVRLTDCRVRSADTGGVLLRTGQPMEFIVDYEANAAEELSKLYVAIGVSDAYGVGVFTCSTAMTNADFSHAPAAGRVVCRLGYLPLMPGRYWVKLKLIDGHGPADVLLEAMSFDVEEDGRSGFATYASRQWGGSVVLPHDWVLEPRHACETEARAG